MSARLWNWIAVFGASVAIACGRAEPEAIELSPTPNEASKAPALSTADVALGRLRRAAADGDFVLVKALLDHGADVNGLDPLDPDRNTALHAAAGPGHFPVAKLLVQRGADATAKNALGETPLDIARRHDHEAIVVLLGMRQAGEEPPAQTAAAPLDPSKLDPGALIAKLKELSSAEPKEREPPAAPEAAEPTAHAVAATQGEAAATPPVASTPVAEPAAPEPPPDPAQREQRRQLCAQLESAVTSLGGAQTAELEALGIPANTTLQQLELVRAACSE